jgi:hypothetical protein
MGSFLMPTRVLLAILAALVFPWSAALAEQSATVTGPPTAAEATFVHAMQAILTKRFPTPAQAVAAGYFRYTNEDETGAISYADLHWQSADVGHPSQLWYDKAGNLLGADYSVLKTVSARPKLWGIQPGRWDEFGEHIHYVTKDPKTGALGYDHYVLVPKFVAAGGSLKHPAAATLVKLHLVASASDVATIFDFPEIWDLIVWVKPNPNGAFADKNPLVKP